MTCDVPPTLVAQTLLHWAEPSPPKKNVWHRHSTQGRNCNPYAWGGETPKTRFSMIGGSKFGMKWHMLGGRAKARERTRSTNEARRRCREVDTCTKVESGPATGRPFRPGVGL